MATCTRSIQLALTSNTTESLPFIVSNTPMPITFRSLGNTLVRFSLPQNDTLRFNINLSSTGIVNFQITFYKIDLINKTFNNIGGVNSTDTNFSFVKDFTIGEYIICFYSTNSSTYTGQFTTIFSNFTPHARLSFIGYSGHYSPPLTINTVINILPCNKPLFYEIIDGMLPEGLQMTGSGTIYGTLPNLDCMYSNTRLSPSSNWYTMMPTGLAYPYGRQWRFKVKTTVLGFPSTIFDEQWLSIRVYNDFDLEKNNFLAQMPFQKVVDQVIKPDNTIHLPKTLCPENCNISIETIDPPIGSSVILEPYTDIELFKLPTNSIGLPNQLNITTFKNWYIENHKDNFLGYLAINTDIENRNFIEQIQSSILLQLILIKEKVLPIVDTGFDYNMMSYTFKKELINDMSFLEITTSIMQTDLLGIKRNNYDLDVIYLNHKLNANKTLEFHFIGWRGINCTLS